ncbi:polysaccharide pyruvyl transferase family protein [Thauera sp. JM12B12]|uniref:polysaccharide pyruvyl transferase family protein n=1 Tax=Thauera sp. JM12B12 TaxID=3142262 RepID=UPI0031F37AF5
MRILFLNTGTSRNIGDRAMLMNVCGRILQKNPETDFLSVSDLPQEIKEELHVTTTPNLSNCWGRYGTLQLPSFLDPILKPIYIALSTMIFATLLRAPRFVLSRAHLTEAEIAIRIRESDAVWMNGGGYLTDEGALEARDRLLIALLASLSGTPVVLTGQGIGPIKTLTTRVLLKLVIANAQVLYTRDHKSYELALNLSPQNAKRIKSGFDDAGSLATLNQPPPKNTPTRIIGIHFRLSKFHSQAKAYETEIFLAVKYLIEREVRVKLFCFHENSEYEISTYKEWAERLQNNPLLEIVSTPDPRVIRGHIDLCSACIGSAYHFVLFSLLSSKPVRAISSGTYYHQKFKGLEKHFGVQDLSLDADELNKDKILTFITGAMNHDNSHNPTTTSSALADATDRQIDDTYSILMQRIREMRT